MHYRNGREAQNGDRVIQLGHVNGATTVVAFGILHDAVPGNSYCNGSIAPLPHASACIIDCLNINDAMALIDEAGLGQRPEGK